MNVTLKDLQQFLSSEARVEYLRVPDADSVQYEFRLNEDWAELTGRTVLLVSVTLDSEANVIRQLALTVDYLTDDQVPLAVAACNAWNSMQAGPTAYITDLESGYDLEFCDTLDIDSGLTATVTDALHFFPLRVYQSIRFLHAEFGL